MSNKLVFEHTYFLFDTGPVFSILYYILILEIFIYLPKSGNEIFNEIVSYDIKLKWDIDSFMESTTMDDEGSSPHLPMSAIFITITYFFHEHPPLMTSGRNRMIWCKINTS